MGMVVRTNTMALNSFRQLNLNNSAVAGSIEKLSSGFRINRAADDASGLAISEKMKAQITGLEAATQNAQDAISLVQTAEGALAEVHDMLNRMVELAEKSANGILEHNMKYASGTDDAFDDTVGIHDNGVAATGTDRQALQDEMNQLCAEIDRIAQSANFNKINLFDGTLAESGLTLQIGDTGHAFNMMTVNMTDMTTSKLFSKDVVSFDALSSNANASGNLSSVEDLTETNPLYETGEVLSNDETGITFNISTQTHAQGVLDAVRTVINHISSKRAELGAIQNRLDYTINNLNTTAENMTAANSRIRDTDMADEMMTYTKMNVLVQSAQAMLAQANQQPQSVLQLLQ